MTENIRPISISVRNVLGVRTADLRVDPGQIALVGGLNAAGKSSLLEAIGAAVCQTAKVRGVTTKKAAASIVNESAAAGTSSYDYGDGRVVVRWPDAEVQTTGAAVALGTPLGIGTASFSALPEKDRMSEIAARMGLDPTRQALEAWFDELPQSDRPPATAVEALWQRIDQSGWDSVFAASKDAGTALAGEWKGITGETFGGVKAGTWIPKILVAGEAYDVEKEQAALDAARAELEAIIAANAVSASKRAEASALARMLPEAQAEADAAQKACDAALAALEHLLRDRGGNADDPTGAHAIVTGAHGPAPCPACATPLTATIKGDGTLALTGYDPGSAKIIAEAQAKRRESAAALKAQEGEARLAQSRLDRAMNALEAARNGAAELAKLEALPAADDEKIAELRSTIAHLGAKIEAINKARDAQLCYRRWKMNSILMAALAPPPGGVRGKVLETRMADINANLRRLADIAKWPAVTIGTDGTMLMGGRDVRLCSESERWRADLMMTVLFARAERATIILVDRMDVLVKQQRPGVFYLLRETGIPAICMISMPEPGAMPNLVASGYGKTYWMEGGDLKPCGE